jgi:SAM-dependent methyltransferase
MTTTPYQLFPALDSATESALRASIDRFGVLVPIAKDQHGNIIDGHHRVRIAEELGVRYRVDVIHVESEDHAREMAATLNTDRRHMTQDQRLAVVRDLLLDVDPGGIGRHSTTAIANAVGVSQSQIRDDIDELSRTAKLSPEDLPDKRRGLDGKVRPSKRTPAPTPEPDDEAELFAPGEEQAIVDNLAAALGRDPDADELAQAKAECVDSKRIPEWTPRKPDLGGGVSHPARYSAELLPIFAEMLRATVGPGAMVLDPFAGTGRIHELHPEFDTYGIELEPEWADLHERTQVGDATALPFPAASMDAIVTSPTYGNRLADSHNASDPERRRSYTHDLGRSLSEGNSGAMHWRNGGDGSAFYRDLHLSAWREAERVLRPGGVFILNMKDHYRDGRLQPVTAWHTWALGFIGALEYLDSRAVETRDLRQGANGELRSMETVHLFRKGDW